MSSPAAHGWAHDGLRLGRYLPLSLAVTLAVVVLPVAVVAQLGPARGALAIGLHVLGAVALSVVLARLIALLWSRNEHSSDLVFADLLLWGWARRFWAERRLEAASRSLVEPAAPTADRAALLRRLSALLERRDPYTHGHSKRVARHAERIARGMGLPREQVARVRAAALVHDIGKINVPRSVLTKPSRLTDAEFELVKRHAADGARMVSELGDPELAAIVRHHHERLDGGGYPDGLAGADIPLGARIIAVADTFDAITSPRPYRRQRTHREALEVVRGEAGAQLDPDAVAAFSGYYSARWSVGWAAVLLAAPQRLLSGLGGVQSGLAAGAAPLAQTACSVGAVALVGTCLGASALPDPVGERTQRHEVATAGPTSSDASATAPAATPGDAGDRSDGQGERRSDDAAPGGRDRDTPRGFRAPGSAAPGSGLTEGTPNDGTDDGGSGGGSQNGGGSNGGSGGGSGGPGGVPTPELPPVVPEPPTVLDPVTDALPEVRVPPVQVPAPAPVPQVQVPGVALP